MYFICTAINHEIFRKYSYQILTVIVYELRGNVHSLSIHVRNMLHNALILTMTELRHVWILQVCPGLWHCTVLQEVTNILEECINPIMRVERLAPRTRLQGISAQKSTINTAAVESHISESLNKNEFVQQMYWCSALISLVWGLQTSSNGITLHQLMRCSTSYCTISQVRTVKRGPSLNPKLLYKLLLSVS